MLEENFELERYYLLDFESKIETYIQICKLNSTRYSKNEFLEKLHKFCWKEFFKSKKELRDEPNHKINYLRITMLIDLLKKALQAIIKFKWELSLFTSSDLLKLEFILDESFIKNLELIEIDSLISSKFVKEIQEVEKSKMAYKLLDLIVILLNYAAKILTSRKKFIRALFHIFQAIQIKKILLISKADLFYFITLNTNFMMALENKKEPGKAFSVIKKLLIVLELWESKIKFTRENKEIFFGKTKNFITYLPYIQS